MVFVYYKKVKLYEELISCFYTNYS